MEFTDQQRAELERLGPHIVAIGAVAARQVAASGRRARALAMVRRLHADIEKAGRGRSVWWCSVAVIVKRPADVDVLSFAVEQGWIELSPGAHSVRVTDEGERAIRPV